MGTKIFDKLQKDLKINISHIRKSKEEHYKIIEEYNNFPYNEFEGEMVRWKRDAPYERSLRALEEVEKIVQQPYLGQMKIVTHDGDIKENYIGFKALDVEDLTIIDWRSEFGKIFWQNKRYSPNFNILRNRKISIYNGKLERYHDEDLTGSNEVVDIERNKLNKEILNTINQEQLKVFKSEGNLLIQGVPGSGKSIVGTYKLVDESYEQPIESNFIYLTNSEKLVSNLNVTFDIIGRDKIKIMFFNDVLVFDKLFYQHNNTNPSNLSKHEKEIEKKRRKTFIDTKKREFNKYLSYNKTKKVFDLMNSLNLEALLIKDELYYFDMYLDVFNNKLSQFKPILSLFEFNYIVYIFSIFNYFIHYNYDNNTKVIYIDEAQDYTITELYFLKNIYPSAKLIFCGDVNQSNGVNYSHDNWNLVIKNFNTKLIKLNRCFRSSKRIVEQFNLKMTTRVYGEAYSLEDTPGEIINFKNYNHFTNSKYHNDVYSYALIYLKPSTGKYLNNKYKNHTNIYSAYDIKGLEFETTVLFDIDEIKLNRFNTKFRYMLASRSYKNIYTILAL